VPPSLATAIAAHHAARPNDAAAANAEGEGEGDDTAGTAAAAAGPPPQTPWGLVTCQLIDDGGRGAGGEEGAPWEAVAGGAGASEENVAAVFPSPPEAFLQALRAGSAARLRLGRGWVLRDEAEEDDDETEDEEEEDYEDNEAAPAAADAVGESEVWQEQLHDMWPGAALGAGAETGLEAPFFLLASTPELFAGHMLGMPPPPPPLQLPPSEAPAQQQQQQQQQHQHQQQQQQQK
jgi:hypothetical protein